MNAPVAKPKDWIRRGWVCPNCGNLSPREADRCTDIRFYPGEGWVETACDAPKPNWIDDE